MTCTEQERPGLESPQGVLACDTNSFDTSWTLSF